MVLSRRELLFGVALAKVTGCRRSFDPGAVDGAFAGEFTAPSPERGHRLRSPGSRAPTRRESAAIAIVGAGPAGLSAGWRLARRGHEDFVVLELEDHPGGASASHALGGLACPLGAHYLPAPGLDNPDLLSLLAETKTYLGEDARGAPVFEETHLVALPEERVFYGGTWHEGLLPRLALTAEDRTSLGRFRARLAELSAYRDPDGRRAFALPVARSSDAPALLALDRLSMAEWLDREGLTGRVFRWWVEYGCRDDFGAGLADTSAWAGLHYFAARSQDGEDSAPYLTWPDGNGFLVRHLASVVGPRLRTGRLVAEIRPTPGGAEVLALDGRTGEWVAIAARRIIFALPTQLRRFVLTGFDAAPSPAPEYSPWLVANLYLAGRPRAPGVELAWDNVLFDSPSLGYVVATHQLLRERGPTVFTYYLPLVDRDARRAREELLGLTHADAVRLVLSDLAVAHPELPGLVRRVDVTRLGHGMVRPVPGSLTSPDRAARARPLGPISFAHSDLSGIALFEEAFAHGLRAADEALAG